MIGIIITFGLGYFIWKYVPKMISHCSKQKRQIIEIFGIILMVVSVISFITSLFHLLSL